MSGTPKGAEVMRQRYGDGKERPDGTVKPDVYSIMGHKGGTSPKLKALRETPEWKAKLSEWGRKGAAARKAKREATR